MHGDPRPTGTDGVTYSINVETASVLCEDEHVPPFELYCQDLQIRHRPDRCREAAPAC
jgi:hypothetical protein